MGESQLVLSWASRTYREECTIVAVTEATGTRGWESAHGDSSAQQQYVCNAHDENKGTAANATRKGVVEGQASLTPCLHFAKCGVCMRHLNHKEHTCCFNQ